LILPFTTSPRSSRPALCVFTLLTRHAEAHFGYRFESGGSDLGLTAFTTPVGTSVEAAQCGLDFNEARYCPGVERGPDTPVDPARNVFCLAGPSCRSRRRCLIEIRPDLCEQFRAVALELFP
jgi:hypothetical protein